MVTVEPSAASSDQNASFVPSGEKVGSMSNPGPETRKRGSLPSGSATQMSPPESKAMSPFRASPNGGAGSESDFGEGCAPTPIAASEAMRKPRQGQDDDRSGARPETRGRLHGKPPFEDGPAGEPARGGDLGRHPLEEPGGLAHRRLLVQPGGEDVGRNPVGRSCRPSREERQPRLGIERRAQLLGGAGEPGLHRPDRDAEDLGRLLHRQAQVVVEDERGRAARGAGPRSRAPARPGRRSRGRGPARPIANGRDAGHDASADAGSGRPRDSRPGPAGGGARPRSGPGSRSALSWRQAATSASWVASSARSLSRRMSRAMA